MPMGTRGNAPELLLTAAAPIMIEGRTAGAVVLEQAGDQLLALRDRALTRLFNLTLIATAAAVIIMFGFATWISLRIGRLRRRRRFRRGQRRQNPPRRCRIPAAPMRSAICRAASRDLLSRLNEHTQYLRTLGGKLSHELRTPLTIVRSSLDNLESEGLREDQQRYVTRAREGTQRLQSILERAWRGCAGRGKHQAIGAGEFRFARLADLGGCRLPGWLSRRQISRSMRRRSLFHARRARSSGAVARQAHRKRRGFLPCRRHDHRASGAGAVQLSLQVEQRRAAHPASAPGASVRIPIRTAPGPR